MLSIPWTPKVSMWKYVHAVDQEPRSARGMLITTCLLKSFVGRSREKLLAGSGEPDRDNSVSRKSLLLNYSIYFADPLTDTPSIPL